MRIHTRLISLVIAVTSTTYAMAANNQEHHNNGPVSNDSSALGLGIGVGIGAGFGRAESDAWANANGLGLGGNATGGNASVGPIQTVVDNDNSSGASAYVAGSDDDLTFSNDTDALAIGFSSATAAPMDASICRIKQTAGWDVNIGRRSGRNIFDIDCLKCERLVARYQQLGQVKLALAVMARPECGGEPVPEVLESANERVESPSTVVIVPPSNDRNDERLERVFQSLQSK